MQRFRHYVKNQAKYDLLAMKEMGYWLKGLRPYAGANINHSWMAKHFSQQAFTRYGYPPYSQPYLTLRGGMSSPLAGGKLARSVWNSKISATTRSVTLTTTNAPIYARIIRHGGSYYTPKVEPYMYPRGSPNSPKFGKGTPMLPKGKKVRRALAWYNASMGVEIRSRVKRHQITIPGRDYFAFVPLDRIWASKALAEIKHAQMFGKPGQK
jgi:hypothetical protein